MNCQNIREAIEMRRTPETAHLAQCQSCETYFREMGALFSLLKDQPRFEVPNDFDFRLRGRIAQVRAEQREVTGGMSWIGQVSQLWSGSFSWVQATAATAAIAAVVTISSYQFLQHEQVLPATGTVATSGQASSSQIAANSETVAAMVSSRASSGQSARGTTTPPRAMATVSVSAVAEQTRIGTGSLAVNAGDDTGIEKAETAAGAGSTRIFNNAQGQMISTSQQMTLIGAEGAGSINRQAGFVPSI